MTAGNHPLVKDLAIPIGRYPHLRDSETLHDAAQVILSYTCGENERLRYSELLVLNDQNQLVGRVTIHDILEGLDSRFKDARQVSHFEGKGSEFPDLAILWEDSFFDGCSARASTLIKDFMSPARRIVKGSDPLLKVLSIMLSTNDLTLPVAEKNHIIGVIRLEEIFKAVCIQCNI